MTDSRVETSRVETSRVETSRVETSRVETSRVGDGILIDLTVDPPAIVLDHRRVPLDPSSQRRRSQLAGRALDVVGSSVSLVLGAPLMVAIAVAVRCSSPGPVVFRSRRAGQDGTPFDAFKFRTMHVDAEAMLIELLASDPVAREEYHRTAKLKEDPRVTPLGRILRHASLDELPQLWNVLRGDMSLVGPRPNLLDEPHRYGPALATVRRVKPGLTGLWQVSGRSELSFDDRIMLDVEYATSRTLRGDLRLLVCTIAHLARRDGAY